MSLSSLHLRYLQRGSTAQKFRRKTGGNCTLRAHVVTYSKENCLYSSAPPLMNNNKRVLSMSTHYKASRKETEQGSRTLLSQVHGSRLFPSLGLCFSRKQQYFLFWIQLFEKPCGEVSFFLRFLFFFQQRIKFSRSL